ncbi:MAG: hypothetical protein JOY62_17490 [Acidobacteriaceae bacterium]|nr:hypothetical protein [Acidobacteriaceae bacterium]MBV9781760.1 hypothetical protein [Acidobacteriaceae bacterium]
MAMESHPTEDELERFLLDQTPEEELESLETHILACNACVGRLEDLEVQIAATRVALRELQQEQTAKAAARERSWRDWLTVPKLSMVGAVAALAIGVAVVPNMMQHGAPVTETSLSAYRGAESSVLPANHRLHVHLNAHDLAQGPVTAKLVDARGSGIWETASQIRHEEVDLLVPSIKQPGSYLLQLYASTQGNPENELLREFAFEVK